jgi:hypothetical protein
MQRKPPFDTLKAQQHKPIHLCPQAQQHKPIHLCPQVDSIESIVVVSWAPRPAKMRHGITKNNTKPQPLPRTLPLNTLEATINVARELQKGFLGRYKQYFAQGKSTLSFLWQDHYFSRTRNFRL